MSLLNALILGLIQGVSEFLPISSSGHLSIAQNLFGVEMEGTGDLFFEVMLHLGTLAAVFVVYRKDIWEMICEFFRTVGDLRRGTMPKPVPPARRMILLLVMGTLPLFLVLPVKDFVEGLSANTYVVGGALLVTGVLLFASDRVRKGSKNAADAPIPAILLVGLSQVLATCPGLSRSGTTIALGCFVGLERKFAVRFAFLLSIPAVLGANMLNVFDVMEAGIDTSLIPAYLLGVAAAAVSGYLSIRLVHMITDKGRFGSFAYYCWAMGAVTILLTALR